MTHITTRRVARVGDEYFDRNARRHRWLHCAVSRVSLSVDWRRVLVLDSSVALCCGMLVACIVRVDEGERFFSNHVVSVDRDRDHFSRSISLCSDLCGVATRALYSHECGTTRARVSCRVRIDRRERELKHARVPAEVAARPTRLGSGKSIGALLFSFVRHITYITTRRVARVGDECFERNARADIALHCTVSRVSMCVDWRHVLAVDSSVALCCHMLVECVVRVDRMC